MNLLAKMKIHTVHQKVFAGLGVLLFAVASFMFISKSFAQTQVTIEPGEEQTLVYVVYHTPLINGSCSAVPEVHFAIDSGVGIFLNTSNGGIMNSNQNFVSNIPPIVNAGECQAWVRVSSGLLGWVDVLTLTGPNMDYFADSIIDFTTIINPNSRSFPEFDMTIEPGQTDQFKYFVFHSKKSANGSCSETPTVDFLIDSREGSIILEQGGAGTCNNNASCEAGENQISCQADCSGSREFATGVPMYIQSDLYSQNLQTFPLSPMVGGPYSVSGQKFNDLNNNSVKDAGEPGLPGWTIDLSGFVSDSTTTDANGDYSFVSDDECQAWVKVSNSLLGITSMLAIARDATGASVAEIWRISDFSYPNNYGSATYFHTLSTAIYNINEQQQNNWTQTFPVGGGYALSFSGAQGATGKDFGNSVALPPIPNLIVNGCPSPIITSAIVGNNIVYTIVCLGGGTYTVTVPIGTVPTNGGSIVVDIKDTNGNNQIQISNATLPTNTTKTLKVPRPAGNINLCVTDSPQVTDINPKPGSCLPPGTAYYIPKNTNTFSPAVNHSLYTYDINITPTDIEVTGLTNSDIEIVPDTDDDGVFDNEDQCMAISGTGANHGCPSGLKVSVEEVNASVKPNVQGDTALETKVFDMSANSCANIVGAIPQNWAQIYDSCDVYNTQTETLSPNGAKGPRNFRSDLVTLGTNAGDNLVIVRSRQNSDGSYGYIGFKVLGLQAGETRSVGFELPPGQPNNFIQTAYFTKNSKGIWTGSRVAQTITGSFLQIIMPEFIDWSNNAQIYPFTFIADSDFDVDVCLSVPTGYTIVAPGTCSQTLISNEAKVLEFTLAEVGSPKKFDVSTKMKIKHKGKIYNVDLKIPSYNKHANGK